MPALTALIPYTTHPVLELGPLTIRTFGLMTALGAVLGISYAARHGEHFGMTREETYRLGTRMVIAGVIGSRITWVATHWDEIKAPIDVIAVWNGGLQFSGGFVFALAIGMPTFRSWNRIQRWQLLDGFGVAVLLGAGLGRIGCLAVGEHFGRQSDFFLATRFDGGEIREQSLGLGASARPVVPGVSFLNPALYEMVILFLLFAGLGYLLTKRPPVGTVAAVFLGTYSIQRFLNDSIRVNDERVLGLTGAQGMSVVMLPTALYVWFKVRPAVVASLAAGQVGGLPVVETSTSTTASGSQLVTTKRRSSAKAPLTPEATDHEDAD